MGQGGAEEALADGEAGDPVAHAGRCRAAQLASIRQMSGELSRGLPGDYQSDQRAGVARLSWRVSFR